MSSPARLRKCAKRIPPQTIKRTRSCFMFAWTSEMQIARCLNGKVRVCCHAENTRGAK